MVGIQTVSDWREMVNIKKSSKEKARGYESGKRVLFCFLIILCFMFLSIGIGSLFFNNNQDYLLTEPSQALLDSSENFFLSFVDKNDFKNDFKVGNKIFIEDADSGVEEEFIVYYYKVEYARENGKRVTSIYPLRLKLDSEEIINGEEVKEKYEYLKERGV